MRDNKDIVRSIWFNILALLGLVVTIIPFLWMIFTSVKSPEEIFVFPPKIFPKKFYFYNYVKLFKEIAFFQHFKNTFIVTISSVLLNLFLSSLAAFSFAKYEFKGKKTIFTLLLSTMMIPGQMTMIPVFLLLKKLGLLNTYLALILTSAVSVYGIFLIRQFMLSIPDELIEAARVDGCPEFLIFIKIVLPLCKPILSTLGIFAFMGCWNDFLWPLIVMIKKEMYTLTVALANLNSQYATDYGLLMAAATIVVLPVLIVFFIGQKFIIRSIMISGMKE